MKHDPILAANADYAAGFADKAELQAPPARRLAILTCMDARLDPAKFAGLVEGDAHVIRNAGGRASDDAIRSLIISSKLLGTRACLVIHHTDCGMETFNDAVVQRLQQPAVGSEATTPVPAIDWLAIHDRQASVLEDVERIRHHPLIPADFTIDGYLYDCATGRLHPVG